VEDKKLRIEDAKNATFAAVEEGILPGGGTALLHLSELLPEFRKTVEDDEERLGVDIVMKALRAPCRQIAHNAGVEGDVIVEAVLGQSFEVGYNAMDDKIEDLLAKGIIDPAKVTRNGLMNACSIAGVMLTTQAVMYETPKEELAAATAAITKADELRLTKSGVPPGLSI
jgi:chaperonin GroEL (HSP60 family)